MTDAALLMLAAMGGVACGIFFFGGLWWTLRHGLRSSAPAPWFLGSFLVRTATVVTVFFYVGNGDWRRMLVCLLGFFGARVAIRRIGGTP